jgi:hypothetical protein
MLELARSKGHPRCAPLRQGAPAHWPLALCPLYPSPSPLLAPLWPFKRPASPHPMDHGIGLA